MRPLPAPRFINETHRRRAELLPGRAWILEAGEGNGAWSFLGTTSRWLFVQGKRICRVATWKVKYRVVPDSPFVDASYVDIEVDCQVNTAFYLSEKHATSQRVLDTGKVNLSRIANRMIQEMTALSVLSSRAKPRFRQDVKYKPTVAEMLASQG